MLSNIHRNTKAIIIGHKNKEKIKINLTKRTSNNINERKYIIR